MGRPKKASTGLEPVDIVNAPSTSEVKIQVEPTLKEELQKLHAEMVKYGIHSIGQLEV